jgi:hypothetical protein
VSTFEKMPQQHMLTKEKVKVKMKTKLQRTKLMSQGLKND